MLRSRSSRAGAYQVWKNYLVSVRARRPSIAARGRKGAITGPRQGGGGGEVGRKGRSEEPRARDLEDLTRPMRPWQRRRIYRVLTARLTRGTLARVQRRCYRTPRGGGAARQSGTATRRKCVSAHFVRGEEDYGAYEGTLGAGRKRPAEAQDGGRAPLHRRAAWRRPPDRSERAAGIRGPRRMREIDKMALLIDGMAPSAAWFRRRRARARCAHRGPSAPRRQWRADEARARGRRDGGVGRWRARRDADVASRRYGRRTRHDDGKYRIARGFYRCSLVRRYTSGSRGALLQRGWLGSLARALYLFLSLSLPVLTPTSRRRCVCVHACVRRTYVCTHVRRGAARRWHPRSTPRALRFFCARHGGKIAPDGDGVYAMPPAVDDGDDGGRCCRLSPPRVPKLPPGIPLARRLVSDFPAGERESRSRCGPGRDARRRRRQADGTTCRIGDRTVLPQRKADSVPAAAARPCARVPSHAVYECD